MTPESLKRAQALTSTISYIDCQITAIKDASKHEGMGLTYASFEIPNPRGPRLHAYDKHEGHHESISLEGIPEKTQQELFKTVSKAVVSKLAYRRRVAKKELASL